MDILEILETSAREIRELRGRVEADGVTRANQTLRLAIHQMRNGPIQYKEWATEPEWSRLNELIDAGRVRMDSAAEVVFDMKTLTYELLAAEMNKTTKTD